MIKFIKQLWKDFLNEPIEKLEKQRNDLITTRTNKLNPIVNCMWTKLQLTKKENKKLRKENIQIKESNIS